MASENQIPSRDKNPINNSPDEEYIDIIDVLGFIWRAKYFMIAGIVIALAATLAIVTYKKPPVFVTTIPVSLDVLMGTDANQMQSKFTELLDLPSVQQGLQSAGFVAVGGKTPFTLIKSGKNLFVEYRSVRDDITGETALKALTTLTGLAQEVNATQDNPVGNATNSESRESAADIEFRQLVTAQITEAAPFRTKLFALESRLAKMAGTNPIPALVTPGNPLGDDVFRLLGAASDKLSATETVEIVRKYAILSAAIQAIDVKYDAARKKLTSVLSETSDITSAVTKGYPVVIADEAAFRASVAIGNHKRYESKRAMFLVLGVMLGTLLGLMTYGVVLFFRENSGRLRAIFSQGK